MGQQRGCSTSEVVHGRLTGVVAERVGQCAPIFQHGFLFELAGAFGGRDFSALLWSLEFRLISCSVCPEPCRTIAVCVAVSAVKESA